MINMSSGKQIRCVHTYEFWLPIPGKRTLFHIVFVFFSFFAIAFVPYRNGILLGGGDTFSGLTWLKLVQHNFFFCHHSSLQYYKMASQAFRRINVSATRKHMHTHSHIHTKSKAITHPFLLSLYQREVERE